LQRALSAQQVYGTAEALVIPIPDMDVVGERYLKLYGSKPDFRAPKQYIHVQREYWAAVLIADDVGYSCFLCELWIELHVIQWEDCHSFVTEVKNILTGLMLFYNSLNFF